MPQYKMKVKNLEDGRIEHVSVWATDRRTAAKQARLIAERLLQSQQVEVQL